MEFRKENISSNHLKIDPSSTEINKKPFLSFHKCCPYVSLFRKETNHISPHITSLYEHFNPQYELWHTNYDGKYSWTFKPCYEPELIYSVSSQILP